MSILRVKHDKKNPYVMINREALWDKDLSLQAIGLWARLLSRPDDWKIYVSELAQSCGLCNETINKIIKELIHHGYAARAQKRKPKEDGSYPNRYGEWEFWIFECKKTPEEISNILSESTFSDPILLDPIKSALLSNEDNQVKIINQEVVENPPPTKDEIDEIDRRLVEARKKGTKILNEPGYRVKVLESIRSQRKSVSEDSLRIERHKKQAMLKDGLMIHGDLVSSLNERVEFTCGNFRRAVSYSVSDDEWDDETRIWLN